MQSGLLFFINMSCPVVDVYSVEYRDSRVDNFAQRAILAW